MGNKRRAEPESEEMDSDDDDGYPVTDSDDDLDELAGGSEDEGDGSEEGGGEGAAGIAGTGKGRPVKRQAIYNVEAIHEKLEDIGWTDGAAWEETLAISHTDPTQVADVDDDLQRELAFYTQALSAAHQAIQQLEAAGTPWQRPLDYFAEMVKTDQHMNKVKKELMYEQQQIEQAEERRKQRESKQYGKQVQLAKEKERQASKKKSIESMTKLRKQREKSGFAGEHDFDAEIEGRDGRPQANRQPNAKKLGQRMGGAAYAEPSKKRLQRDAKFGFGGRKGTNKQNDAESTANMDSYKPGRFSDKFGGGSKAGGKFGAGKGGKFGGGGKGGPGGPKGGGVKKAAKKGKIRPGKDKRAAMKGRS